MAGTVDMTKIAEIHTLYKGFYAQRFTYMINDDGPSVTGSHEDMQAVVNPVWTGIRNLKIECSKPIAVGFDGLTFINTFTCDHVFTDASGAEIEGTRADSFKVTETVTFDGDGKISKHRQEFDLDWIVACQKKVRSAENFAVVKDAF